MFWLGKGNPGNKLNTLWLDPSKFRSGKDVGKHGLEGIPKKGILEGLEMVPIVVEGIAFDTSIGCEAMGVIIVVEK